MRIIVAIGTLLVGASGALAQQQEGKLMDRLLRPNVALANSAQNKKFTGTQPAAFNKVARTHSFSSARKASSGTFSEEQKTFTPQQFAARHFRAGDTAANISSRSELRKNDTVATPAATAGTRVAPESGEAAPVREYAGSRPFLDKGKSQKALSAQNKPLTIEQVRELLNKSK